MQKSALNCDDFNFSQLRGNKITVKHEFRFAFAYNPLK